MTNEVTVFDCYSGCAMSVGRGVKWCSVSRITTPIGTLRTVSLDFDENCKFHDPLGRGSCARAWPYKSYSKNALYL